MVSYMSQGRINLDGFHSMVVGARPLLAVFCEKKIGKIAERAQTSTCDVNFLALEAKLGLILVLVEDLCIIGCKKPDFEFGIF